MCSHFPHLSTDLWQNSRHHPNLVSSGRIPHRSRFDYKYPLPRVLFLFSFLSNNKIQGPRSPDLSSSNLPLSLGLQYHITLPHPIYLIQSTSSILPHPSYLIHPNSTNPHPHPPHLSSSTSPPHTTLLPRHIMSASHSLPLPHHLLTS